MTLKEKLALKKKERRERSLDASPGPEGGLRTRQNRFGKADPLSTSNARSREKGNSVKGVDRAKGMDKKQKDDSDADSDISSIDEIDQSENVNRLIGNGRDLVTVDAPEFAFNLNMTGGPRHNDQYLVAGDHDEPQLRKEKGFDEVTTKMNAFGGEDGFAIPNYGRSVSLGAMKRVQTRVLRELVRKNEGFKNNGVKNDAHDTDDISYDNATGTVHCSPLGVTENDIFLPNGALKQVSSAEDNSLKRPIRMGDSDGVGSFDVPPLNRKLCPVHRSRPLQKMRASEVQLARLSIAVGVVGFDDHQLFCPEDILAARLRWSYAEYCRLVQGDSVNNILQRLTVSIPHFIQEYSEVEKYNLHDQPIGKTLRLTCLQLLEEIAAFCSFKEAELESVRSVYLRWEAVKAERKAQTFTSTTVKLRVKKCSLSEDEKDLLLLLQKAKETVVGYLPIMKKYKAVLEDASVRVVETIQRIGEVINSEANRNPAVLILDDTAPRDVDDSCPSVEELRRINIQGTKIYAKLYLNGKKVGRTKEGNMLPNFRANLHHVFKVDVYHQPTEAKLKIYQVGKVLDQCLGETFLSVPGITRFNEEATSTGVGQIKTVYQFAWGDPIEKEIVASKRAREFEKQLRQLPRGKIKNDPSRYTHGFVGTNIEWMALPGTDKTTNGCKLPPKSDQDILGRGSCRIIGSEVSNGDSSSQNVTVNGDELLDKDMLPVVEKMPGIDPNDPENEDVSRMLAIMKNVAKTGDIFRLDPSDPAAMFATAKRHKFKESMRSTLMKLRNDRPALFHGLPPVPLDDLNIKKDIKFMSLLKQYMKSVVEDHLQEEEASGYLEDQIRQHQMKVQNFFHRVQAAQSMLDRSSKASMAVHVNAVVKEGVLPNFNFNFGNFSRLFAPRRKLRPAPRPRSMQARPKEVYIIVNLGRAYNLPVRLQEPRRDMERGRDRSPRKGSSPERRSRSPSRDRGHDLRGKRDDEKWDNQDEEDEMDLLNCYAEISFQGTTVRSNTVSGESPHFGQNFHIKLNPDGIEGRSLTPRNLVTIQDEIRICLFDKVEMHAQGNTVPGLKRREVALRSESRFLGSFSIPFTTVYLNKQVSGLIPIEKPIFNYAYNSQYTDNDDAKLRVMMTTEPALQPPLEDETPPLIGEDANLARHADRFMTKYKRNSSFAQRNLKLMAQNIHQESLLIIRYVCAQTPPPSIDGRGLMNLNQAIRFVSLIPFIDDWQAFQGETEIWCSSKEFLELRAGDWEEHALLLLNYMLHIDGNTNDWDHFLVLGTAIPEGDTVYVMRRKRGVIKSDETDDIVLYDASSGKEYIASDSTMPLLSIGCLVNRDNIWANIQDSEAPHLLSFDLENSKLWRPFFDKTFPKPELQSYQEPDLTEYYAPINHAQAETMEREILETLQQDLRRCREEDLIGKNGSSKRRGVFTRFDSSVGNALKDTLEFFEKCKQEEDNYDEQRYRELLESSKGLQSFHDKTLHGFPINSTFTDLKSLSAKVRATNIHLNESDDVKFALAVKVFPYPQEVYSIWIFLLSICPRQTHV